MQWSRLADLDRHGCLTEQIYEPLQNIICFKTLFARRHINYKLRIYIYIYINRFHICDVFEIIFLLDRLSFRKFLE